MVMASPVHTLICDLIGKLTSPCTLALNLSALCRKNLVEFSRLLMAMCSLFTLRLPPSYFPVELNGFEAFVAWCNSTTYVRVELHPTKPEAFCLRSRGWRLPRVSRKLQFIDWRSSVVQDDSKNWPWRIFVFIACNRFLLPRGFFFASGFPFGIALHEGVGILVSSRRSISKDGIGVGPRALHTLNVYNRVCTLALAIKKTSMSQLFGLFNQAYRKNPQPTNVSTLWHKSRDKKYRIWTAYCCLFPCILVVILEEIGVYYGVALALLE